MVGPRLLSGPPVDSSSHVTTTPCLASCKAVSTKLGLCEWGRGWERATIRSTPRPLRSTRSRFPHTSHLMCQPPTTPKIRTPLRLQMPQGTWSRSASAGCTRPNGWSGSRNPCLATRSEPVPRNAAAAAELKQRTLTKLYNARSAWLSHAHEALDAAVAESYGWPADISEDDALAALLALNLERS